MNDRYLYKAKKVDNGQWVEGFYFLMGGDGVGHCIGLEPLQANDYSEIYKSCYDYIDISTLCQCTGLKDKNNRLIWENDIVRCVDKNSDIEFTARVEFGNPNGEYNWGWQLHHLSGDKPNLDILLWIETEESGAFCEIIGNIFDNPELLEA